MPSSLLRFRLYLGLTMLAIVPLGYWLRFQAPIPPHSRDMTGGASYVLFWSTSAIFLQPRLSILKTAAAVLAVTCCLEFLQLWHPLWLEAARSTLPGRLILGTTFDWSDFPPYFLGALLTYRLLTFLQSYSRKGTG